MPKRSLMLAGGGVKSAFQAGVLQVWLDEVGIEFDHADAVSVAWELQLAVDIEDVDRFITTPELETHGEEIATRIEEFLREHKLVH